MVGGEVFGGGKAGDCVESDVDIGRDEGYLMLNVN